ncbi:MAG: galactokinase family protein [Eubacteriales bacterium]|nr:galactokinase family protein [Eubacteriales bacterium]
MNANEMRERLKKGARDERLISLYGNASLDTQRARYDAALKAFGDLYSPSCDIHLFSVAGRSELSGNHTDHNRGCVVAASIDLDIIAVAAATRDGVVRVKSEGFPEDIVRLAEFTQPRPERFSKSDAIIAGMCAGFRREGYRVGGFNAYTTSSVLKGSGLSSSAAFEDMIGNILSHLYNDGRVSNVEIAKLAQYAENAFFGKPCGLMDQMACAVGGIIAIDFADEKNPQIEKIDFDVTGAGYNLCIVNTGGNHADLTPDYAAVPAEMKAVAAALGKSVLRETDEESVIAHIPELRKSVGDRAILRALHFFAENRRVAAQKEALQKGDLPTFLSGVIASGRSSFCYLQNVYTTKNVAEQGLSLALCLAERYLSDKGGAFRVHGGGFAGTIQAYVKFEDVPGFCQLMDGIFGKGATIVLCIRPDGAIRVD